MEGEELLYISQESQEIYLIENFFIFKDECLTLFKKLS
jgi:hypothetical protein